MRILEVITSLLTGGAEHIVVQLCQSLRLKGYDIDLCVFDGENTSFMQEVETTGCKIYKLSNGPNFYNPLYIVKLHKIFKQYNIIHTHNSSPQLFAALANIGLNRKLITTEHNTYNSKRNNPALSLIDRWMYGRYDLIVTISQQAENNLLNYLKIKENKTSKKIITIKNGVDVSSFYEAIPYQDGELKDENGENIKISERCNIIQVAAFRAQKDQLTLINALKDLPPHFHIWLVGDGDLRKQIHEYAKNNERVHFFGNRKDVARLLKTASIVCMSTHYEGLSLSNIEGMSAGKAFVASDVEGIHEVTQNAGILFKDGDSKSLAKIFKCLYNDHEYYNTVALACFQRAKEYDISQMVEEYRNVYEAIEKK